MISVACGPSTSQSSLPVGSGSPSAATSASAPGGTLPAPAPDRFALGATRPVALEASLAPISGSDEVLAFVDHANGPALLLQVVGEKGPAGSPIAIPGAHLVGAFQLAAGRVSVATIEGRLLCLRGIEAKTLGARSCAEASGHALVPVGDRLLVLEVRPPEEESADNAPPRKGSKPKKKPKAKKPKPRTQEDAKKRLMASGRQVEVWGSWLSDGATRGEATFTGLAYREGLAGLSLIGAGSRKEQVELLFYERAEKRGAESRAKIGFAALDEGGTLLEPSRKSFGESKLEPGYLSDRADVRFMTFEEGSVALAHRGPRGRCDITVTSPFVMPMIPDDDDCVIDPRRFIEVARAKRKKVESESVQPVTIDRVKSTRAFGQASWDMGRSVYTRRRAWAFEGEQLVTWLPAAPAAKVERPLLAQRSRIAWGSFHTDGSGVAETDSGLHFVERDGQLRSLAGVEARLVSGPDRDDVAASSRSLAARIGDSWWQGRGELRRISPDMGPVLQAIPHDTSVLVGGQTTGLLLEVSPPVLAVHSLDANGKLRLLGRLSTKVGAGFDAAPRARGGALVSGPLAADPQKIVSFFVTEAGAASAQGEVPLYGDGRGARAGPVRLVALPKGGALLFDEARTRVAWLDDDGAFLKSAALDAHEQGVKEARGRGLCLDGRPAPKLVPSVVPGELLPFEAAEAAGSCVVGEIVFAADGSLRWFGATTDGFHSRAELGLKKGPFPLGAGAAGASSVKIEPLATSPASGSHCPSEMVKVGAGLCVDRFEASLVDDKTGRFLSADYPATPKLLSASLGEWATRRERHGDLFARSFPLPTISAWQRGMTANVLATPRMFVRPSAYVTGLLAKSACEGAGKRLCKLEEWQKACRGEQVRMFPYGTSYEDGACNVNGTIHPAATLHDNASVGHLDPRLNRLDGDHGPLLRRTGDSPRCASKWGADAIYDMVGNVDEWVDEKGGAFAGGFYARSTTSGCEAVITAHPLPYLDYSTGVRCCKDAGP